MRVLLDTHTLIWSVDDSSQLGPQAKAMLSDRSNDLLLSAGSIWEIAIKIALGKLVLSMPFRQWIAQAEADLSLTVLPVNVEYADVLTTLPHHHREPANHRSSNRGASVGSRSGFRVRFIPDYAHLVMTFASKLRTIVEGYQCHDENLIPCIQAKSSSRKTAWATAWIARSPQCLPPIET